MYEIFGTFWIYGKVIQLIKCLLTGNKKKVMIQGHVSRILSNNRGLSTTLLNLENVIRNIDKHTKSLIYHHKPQPNITPNITI